MIKRVIKEENKVSQEQHTNCRKPFANLPITSPWVYKVPISKPGLAKKSLVHDLPAATEDTAVPRDQKDRMEEHVEDSKQPSAKYVGIRSYQQFQHFLRLMQLFPIVHPAFIHSILISCNNDFFQTVDKLIRMRICRQNVNKLRNFSRFANKLPFPSYNRFVNNSQILRNNQRNIPTLLTEPHAKRVVIYSQNSTTNKKLVSNRNNIRL